MIQLAPSEMVQAVTGGIGLSKTRNIL